MSDRATTLNMILGVWGALGTVGTFAALVFDTSQSSLILLAGTGWLCAVFVFWFYHKHERAVNLIENEINAYRQRELDYAGQIAQLKEDNTTLLKAHHRIVQILPIETAMPREIKE